ncbi:MAG TPA: glycosyltransferase [Candidatus Acidoferrum sp.]|nr:glycosyltransferase [Candidatus Acidoferrum sp.]
MVKLSFIVPTKNEHTTPGIIRDIYKVFGRDVEVIVIDKSDPDYRKPLYKTGAKIVIQKTGVYEHALVEGFRLAHGDILAAIDPDGTYSVKDLKKIVDYLSRHTEYAYVGGDRLDCPEKAMPPSIKFGNRLFGLLATVLMLQPMRDTFSGSFAMWRKPYNEIRGMEGYVGGPTIFQIALARKGFKVRCIPISYRERVGSQPKISGMKQLFAFKLAFNMIVGRFS